MPYKMRSRPITAPARGYRNCRRFSGQRPDTTRLPHLSVTEWHFQRDRSTTFCHIQKRTALFLPPCTQGGLRGVAWRRRTSPDPSSGRRAARSGVTVPFAAPGCGAATTPSRRHPPRIAKAQKKGVDSHPANRRPAYASRTMSCNRISVRPSGACRRRRPSDAVRSGACTPVSSKATGGPEAPARSADRHRY